MRRTLVTISGKEFTQKSSVLFAVRSDDNVKCHPTSIYHETFLLTLDNMHNFLG